MLKIKMLIKYNFINLLQLALEPKQFLQTPFGPYSLSQHSRLALLHHRNPS